MTGLRRRYRKWALDARHDLSLSEDGSGLSKLSCDVISAGPGSVVFAVRGYPGDGVNSVRTLALAGSWSADQDNRLNFDVSGGPDQGTLVFHNSWQLGKSGEIRYSYKKAGSRQLHGFCLEGHWQIGDSRRLTYIVGRDPGEAIEFRAQLETLTLYPQKGKIKYRVGVGVRNRLTRENELVFFGEWKFSRCLGINFEALAPGGCLQTVEFGCDIDLSDRDRVNFSLVDSLRQPLGVSVGLTHRFLKEHDAEAYAKLKSLGDDRSIEVGVNIPF